MHRLTATFILTAAVVFAVTTAFAAHGIKSSQGVLIAGGYVFDPSDPAAVASPLASAELYSPETRSFVSTREDMSISRARVTATQLLDGRTLIVGEDTVANLAPTAELYDPSRHVFSATRSSSARRVGHVVALLNSGKVLIAGGVSRCCNGPLATAALYNPSTGKWAATGRMNVPREGAMATALKNGRVLIAGGYDGHGFSNTAELYDPASGSFTRTGNMTIARDNGTATLLPNGKVLLAKGNLLSASAELYDAEAGTFTATGNSTFVGVQGNTATLLSDGTVLIAGGEGFTRSGGRPHSVDNAEIYDPVTGVFTATARMTAARAQATATRLPNGDVLIAGGGVNTGLGLRSLASAELYHPGRRSFSPTGAMSSPRVAAAATSARID